MSGSVDTEPGSIYAAGVYALVSLYQFLYVRVVVHKMRMTSTQELHDISNRFDNQDRYQATHLQIAYTLWTHWTNGGFMSWSGWSET